MSTPAERFRRAMERRAALMQRLCALPLEAHEWRANDDSWSLLEIVEHLVLAEQEVLVDLDDLPRLEARPRSFRNAVLYRLILGILRFRIPVPVPSEGMVPGGGRTMQELAEVWARQHERLDSFLTRLEPGADRATIFAHPVTGPLTIREGIRMLEVHLERHIGQIKRTLALWQRETASSP